MLEDSPIELLISIISDVAEITQNKKLTTKELKQILIDADMPKKEANDIVNWFQNFSAAERYPKNNQNNKNNTEHKFKPRNKNAIRIYSNAERVKIPEDARATLNQLSALQIINNEEKELIIHQAMSIKQSELDLHSMNWICSMVVANSQNSDQIPNKKTNKTNRHDGNPYPPEHQYKKEIIDFFFCPKDKIPTIH